jgi:cell division septation protein DedD
MTFAPAGSPIAADVEQLPVQATGSLLEAYEANATQQTTADTGGRNNRSVAQPAILALAVKRGGEAHPVKVSPKTSNATGAKSGPFWMVQVAAFAQKEDAEALATDLRTLGYDAFTQLGEVDAKIWHRVRVGKIPNRKDAVELQKTLKANNKFEQAFLVTQ